MWICGGRMIGRLIGLRAAHFAQSGNVLLRRPASEYDRYRLAIWKCLSIDVNFGSLSSLTIEPIEHVLRSSQANPGFFTMHNFLYSLESLRFQTLQRFFVNQWLPAASAFLSMAPAGVPARAKRSTRCSFSCSFSHLSVFGHSSPLFGHRPTYLGGLAPVFRSYRHKMCI